MRNEDIKDRIYTVVSKLKGNMTPAMWEDGKQEALTGSYWGLSAIDMTYLFLELEKEFEVTFRADKLVNYEFGTLTGIEKILRKELGLRQ